MTLRLERPTVHSPARTKTVLRRRAVKLLGGPASFPGTRRLRRRRSASHRAHPLIVESLEHRQLLTTLADLDSDGDLDAFHQSVWFENMDGQGNFLAREVSDQQYSLSVAADMDGDGDLDLVSSEPRWYENRSDERRFSMRHEFPAEALSGSEIRTIDLQQDGDVDVLIITGESLALYENMDGQGTMVLRERIAVPNVQDADDIDGDGDLDLVVIRSDESSSQAILLRSDGNEYSESLITEVSDLGWVLRRLTSARFARIDGDAASDVVIESFRDSEFPSSSTSWWRNTGDEFVADNFIGRTSYGTDRLLDIDFDGDLDYVYLDELSMRIAWKLNDGHGDFEQIPGAGISIFDIAINFDPADVNGDGVIDVVTEQFSGGAPLWIDGRTTAPHLNVVPAQGAVQPGDANKDFFFDEADLIQVARSGRYQSGAAEWDDGDWGGGPGGTPDVPPVGDGLFDDQDLNQAFATGLYRSGAYHEEATTPITETEAMRVGIHRAAELELQYTSATGVLNVVNTGAALSAFHLTSRTGILNGEAVAGFDGRFDSASSDSVFRFDTNGFIAPELGAILPAGQTWMVLQNDLKVDGARVGGGGLGGVRLTCTDCGLNVDAFQQAMRDGGWPEAWDFMDDGTLDQLDLRFLLQEVLHTTVGDSNLDGIFDAIDLIDVFAGGQYEDQIVGNSTWFEGDWTGDGEFDSSDLIWAFQVGGYAETVPEPIPPTGAVGFIEHGVEVRKGNRVNTVMAGDIDGDHDVDIVVGSIVRDLTWHQNSFGTGQFPEPRIISNQIVHALSYDLVDIDIDGDLDGLSTSSNNTLAWHENENGEGFFGQPHIVADDLESLQWAVGGDVDKDGDVDVLAATRERLLFYENKDGRGNFGRVKVIDDRELGEGKLIDLDLDGDLDLLAELIWYENNGRGQFAHVRSIANGRASQNDAVDVDGDGDLDLVFGLNEIQWLANDGTQNFDTPRAIGVVSGLTSLAAADMDNDGDVDLLSSSLSDNRIAWYENMNGQGSFQTHVVTSNALFAESVAVADIDGDGDVDILSASRDDDRVSWYENQLI